MDQYAKELMKPARRPREFAHVYADGVDDIWAMDLADMTEWSPENKGFKHILVVVDVFSRFAWCLPLKTKTANEVWTAFNTIAGKDKPHFIWVDKGTEFYNKIWTAKLKPLGIGRYSTYGGEYKVSIAERFVKTIKHLIWFQFIKNNNRLWIDLLPTLVSQYNTTVHSALEMTPTNARLPQNADAIYKLIPHPPQGIARFKLNEWVRISRTKGLFEKGFHPTWSYEIYRIHTINLSVPVRYYIKDYNGEFVDGPFYESELQSVADPTFFPSEAATKFRTVKGVKQALVKFLGYSEPRWVPLSTLEHV